MPWCRVVSGSTSRGKQAQGIDEDVWPVHLLVSMQFLSLAELGFVALESQFLLL